MKKQSDVEYVHLVCLNCHQEFKRTARYVRRCLKIGSTPKFCSKSCKQEYSGRNRVKRICPVCHKEFLINIKDAGANRCCSSECAKQNPYRKGTVTLTCEHCGQQFDKPKSYVEKQTRRGQPVKYCSRECSLAGQGRPKKERVESTCQYCGKQFLRIIDKNTRYCSPECMQSDRQHNKVELKCLHCGKLFVVNRYQAVVVNRKYCSKKCSDQARQIKKDTYRVLQHFLRSSNEYKAWQRAVFANAHYQCEECGSTIQLHAHHRYELWHIAHDYNFNAKEILSSDIFNDINNGECLCIQCHIKRHPYHKQLRDKAGRFCRREFKVTEEIHDNKNGIKLEGESFS